MCLLVIIALQLTHDFRLKDKQVALNSRVVPKYQWLKPLFIILVYIPVFIAGMGGAASALNQIMHDSGPLKQHYSRVWSFGQIIAALVWLPCILECAYMLCGML